MIFLNYMFFPWHESRASGFLHHIRILVWIKVLLLRFVTINIKFFYLFSFLNFVLDLLYCQSSINLFQRCVRTLLEHQADVNARDKNWQIPLHIVAAHNYLSAAGKIDLLHIEIL